MLFLPYIVPFATAFLLNLFIIFLLLKLAHRFRWYDKADIRKVHVGEIPRIGGLGIAISFFLSIFIFSLVFLLFRDTKEIFPRLGFLWSFFIGAALINLVGILDDFANLRPIYKLVGQIAATLIIIFSGHYFQSFYIPFFNLTIESVFLGQVVTFIWIIGITNAVNLIDGMDGFSSTITSLIALLMGFSALAAGDTTLGIIFFILSGSITGFLVYNFPPAKIFMGDSGSLFLGFVLAVLPLYIINDGFGDFRLILGITFLLIPIYDTLGAIIRRKIRGVPFHSPDMDHLHHKLMAIGLSKKLILVLTAIVILILSGTALLFTVYRDTRFVYLQLTEWLVVLLLFIIISIRNKRKTN